MTVPYTFQSGDIASSAEVNENFNHFSDIVGTDSDAGELHVPGTITIGPRSNVQITAESDTEYGEESFVQIGWNTELFFQSLSWNVRRFNADEVANALRIGRNGLEFYGTSNISGSLNTRLNKMFGVRAVSGSDRVYIKSDVHIQRVDDSPTGDLESYRLTYVPFETPVAIVEANNIFEGTKQRIGTTHNVPEHAIAIQITAHIRANAGVPGSLLFKRAEDTPTLGSGFGLYAAGGSQAYGSGIVHLGSEGAHLNRFLEIRSANFAEASIFVQGYWI